MDVWLKSSKQGENVGVEYTMGKEEYLNSSGDCAMHNYGVKKTDFTFPAE